MERKESGQSKNFFFNPYYLSALLLILYIAVLFVFFRIQPETGDDTVLMSILSGAYGKPRAEIIFSNILYGKFLYGLFTAFPGVNWYAWIQFLCTALALYSGGIMILKSFNPLRGLPLLILFYLTLGLDLFIHINFTKNAGILCASGYAILLFEDNWKKISQRSLSAILKGVAAAFFVWIGSMMRFDSFLAVSAIFSLYLLYLFVRECLHKDISSIITAVCSLVLIVGVVFGVYFYNKFYYLNDPQWKEYIDFNSARSRIRDYPIPSYEENQELYDQIGVSYNDYLNLKTYNINDQDFYTIERLNLIADIGDGKEVFNDTLASYDADGKWDQNSSMDEASEQFSSEREQSSEEVGALYSAVQSEHFISMPDQAESPTSKQTTEIKPPFLKGFLKFLFSYIRHSWVYCFLALLFLGWGKERWIAGGLSLVMVLAMSLQLYMNGRYSLIRLHFLLWIAAIYVLLASLKRPTASAVMDDKESSAVSAFERMNIKNRIVYSVLFFAGVASALAGLNLSLLSYSNAMTAPANLDVRDLYQYFKLNKDSVFFMDTSTSYLGENLDYYDYYNPEDTENIVMLGGWYTGSVAERERLAAMDLDLPIAHLADSNAYYVSKTDPDVLLEYMKEHYGIEATADLVTSFGKYNVYRFTSKGASE